jgi:hypothetical protein
MRQQNDHADQPPRREELAAFFDGELCGARRQQLEEWLADHAEAQADLEEWRQLGQAWKTTRPADPGAAAWSGMRQRIESGLPRRALSAWPRRTLVAAAVAAALLLGLVLLYRPAGPSGADDPAEPLTVASAADVEIISMEADDVSALVVGHPPLREALVLADAGDIHVLDVEPGPNGSMPSVRWWTGVDAPMIVPAPDSER